MILGNKRPNSFWKNIDFGNGPVLRGPPPIALSGRKFSANFLKTYDSEQPIILGNDGFHLTGGSARASNGNHRVRKASLKEVVRRQGSLICYRDNPPTSREGTIAGLDMGMGKLNKANLNQKSEKVLLDKSRSFSIKNSGGIFEKRSGSMPLIKSSIGEKLSVKKPRQGWQS
jgi:hypothetical protein